MVRAGFRVDLRILNILAFLGTELALSQNVFHVDRLEIQILNLFFVCLEMSTILLPGLIGFYPPCLYKFASDVLKGVLHALSQPGGFLALPVTCLTGRF